MTTPRLPNDRYLEIYQILLVALWSMIVVVTFVHSLGDSAIATTFDGRASAMALVPQGWSFFTKSPRDSRLWVYRRANGEWHRQDRHNFSPKTLFGLRKGGAINGLEFYGNLEAVPKDKWSSLPLVLAERIHLSPPPSYRLHNRANIQTMCGEYLVVKQAPVPWAWAAYRGRTAMPSEVLLVEVMCK